MQPLAFLWFEMQMTQQYLREKTFGPAPSADNSANPNTPIGAGTLPRISIKELPPMASQWNATLAVPKAGNCFGQLVLGSASLSTTVEKPLGPLDKLI